MNRELVHSVPLMRDELEVLVTLKLRQTPDDIRSPDGSRLLWQPTFAQIEPTYGQRHSGASCALVAGRNTYECERLVSRPADEKPFSLTLRIADTPWQTVSRARFHKGLKVSGDSFVSAPASVPSLGLRLSMQAFPVRLPSRWRDYDYRFMAFDWTGQCHPVGGSFHLKAGQDFQWFQCDSKDVAKIVLQVRPFKTVEFASIQPQPIESPRGTSQNATPQ